MASLGFRIRSTVFAHIFHSEHFYIICFNLKTYIVELLHNRKSSTAYKSRYKSVSNFVQECFCEFMDTQNKNISNEMRAVDVDPVELPWSLVSNHDDCAIFAMWHEENYMSSSQWNAFLEKDNTTQLENLRVRFLIKFFTWKKNAMWKKLYRIVKNHYKLRRIKYKITRNMRA